MKAVDSLESGPEWKCRMFRIPGDLDKEGKEQVEVVELWYRNILDVLAELLGDPELVKEAIFAPRKLYTDDTKTNRIYSEAMTGNWAWETQVRFVVFSSF